MNIVVYVEDPCHPKESCDIIKGLQELIQSCHLEDVTVNASFCIGPCSRKGVTVQIDGEFIEGVTAGGLKDIFSRYIPYPAACAAGY